MPELSASKFKYLDNPIYLVGVKRNKFSFIVIAHSFFLIFCNRKSKKELWVIFIYCTSSVLIDGFVDVSHWAAENKYFIWNLYTILQYSFLVYFFYIILQRKFTRTIMLAVSLVYLIIFIIFSKSDYVQFNSIMSSIGSVILLILILDYIIIALKPSLEPAPIFTPVFVIVIGLLLYLSSTFFLFVIAGRLSVEEMQKYWSINSYANILTNLIISVAFLLSKTEPLKQSPIPRS